jgi:hypothetical protein
MKRTTVTQKKTEKFLACLRRTGNVTQAAQEAGISRQSCYRLRDSDPEFAELWDQAEITGCDMLEAEARRRAVEGVDKPVFYRGEQCGTVKEYSDTLLIVLLKAHRPEKYRERHEIVGKDGQALRVEYIIPGEE